jgi:hypothetical protein
MVVAVKTLTTLNPASDLAAYLAKDIAEGLATGNAGYLVRTPAHRDAYEPLADVVSAAIGMPDCPILTALLALVAGGLKSSDQAMVRLATGALEAIGRAHIDAQLPALIEQDAIAAEEAEYFPFARAA